MLDSFCNILQIYISLHQPVPVDSVTNVSPTLFYFIFI